MDMTTDSLNKPGNAVKSSHDWIYNQIFQW